MYVGTLAGKEWCRGSKWMKGWGLVVRAGRIGLSCCVKCLGSWRFVGILFEG